MKQLIARLLNALRGRPKQLIRIWPVLLAAAVIANGVVSYQQRNNLLLVSQSVADYEDVEEISDKLDEVADNQEEIKSAVDSLESLGLEEAVDSLSRKVAALELYIRMHETKVSFIKECTYGNCSLHQPLYRY